MSDDWARRTKVTTRLVVCTALLTVCKQRSSTTKCQIRRQLRREEQAHNLQEEMVQRERAEAVSEARQRIKDEDRAGSQPDPSDASSTPELLLVEAPETMMGDADQDEEEPSGHQLTNG